MSTVMMALFQIDCLLLIAVPLYFVQHGVYEDGVFGRIGLLGIAFASCGYLLEAWVGDEELEVLPLTVMLATSFAVFLVWHLFRWHRKILRKVAR